jgi:hypothetical protein
MNFHPEENSQEKKRKKHKKKVILNSKKRRYFIKLFLGGNYTFKGCMMGDPIYVFSIIRWVDYNTQKGVNKSPEIVIKDEYHRREIENKLEKGILSITF